MADNNVFECENVLCGSKIEKLYLDLRTADVYFVFSNDVDRLPAHKNILSVGSSVFEAMFYGSLIEKDDILIVDASAAAFKEFLQFFYLNKLRLTSEHIGEVVNLCNKYELLDGLKICEVPLQNSLTNVDMCWGYELAIFLELDQLRQFCEQKIQEFAMEIVTSESFLLCNRKSLEKFMELIKFRCCPVMIINALMDWAKAECDRNNIEKTFENIRTELGDLFKTAPFGDISMEQFFELILENRGLKTDQEIQTITQTIANKKFQSSSFANSPLSILPKLICDRRATLEIIEYTDTPFNCCAFETNRILLMTEFYLPQISSKLISNEACTLELIYVINGPYSMMRGELLQFDKVTLNSVKETRVILPQPIIINEINKGFAISVIGAEYNFFREFSHKQVPNLLNTVDLGDGIEVKFFPGSELISRIVFLQPNV